MNSKEKKSKVGCMRLSSNAGADDIILRKAESDNTACDSEYDILCLFCIV